MAEDRSSPEDLNRKEPPPVPSHRIPPPIPGQTSSSSHAPPPIPRQPPPVPRGTLVSTPTNAEGNSPTHRQPPRVSTQGPSVSTPLSPPAIPRARQGADRPNESLANIIVARPTHHEPVVLCRVALALTLLCIPLSLLGSFWPLLRSPFWITSLVLALLALSLTKFAISSSEKPSPLTKLTLQLSYGFIVISIIGLIAAAFRASLYLSGTADHVAAAVRAAAEAQRGSNEIFAWVLHKIDVLVSFLGTHGSSGAVPAASPSPSPSPQ